VNAVLLVAAGGALGAVARFGFNDLVTRLLGNAFPWGILLVNVLGCCVMGALAAALLRIPGNDTMRLFWATGVLGGFTTFSAFALDTLKLVQGGQATNAIIYVVASVLLSLLAVVIGFALARVMLP
jgi:fluoride exporter